jgi:hypothetical protein
MINRTKIEKAWALLLGFLIVATPVLADSPIDNMIAGLRNAGFNLVLLWLLTLAVVYGVLSQLKLPESMTTRGVISIVVSFLVLIACAGTQVAIFLSTFSSYAIAIAFSLVILMVFLGIVGIKGGDLVFAKNPKFFAGILIVIAVLIFISAGGLGFFAAAGVIISSNVFTVCFFLFIMVASVWMLVKENGES